MSRADRERLIRNRVRAGHNEEQSRRLLEELLAAHDGDNLDFALQYNAFIR